MSEFPCNCLEQGIQQTYKFGNVRIKLLCAICFFSLFQCCLKVIETLPSLGFGKCVMREEAESSKTWCWRSFVDWGMMVVGVATLDVVSIYDFNENCGIPG